MNKLKQEYNEKLARFNKAMGYLQLNLDEYEKWSPEVFKITRELSVIMNELEKQGIRPREHYQVLEGFANAGD